MKKGVRILAISTGPTKGKRTLLLGIVSRDGIIEGVLSSEIAVDSTDSTYKIASMIKKSRFKEQIRLIVLNGMGLAGLNIVDARRLQKLTNTKIISITRKKPHPNELIKALRAFSRDTEADVKERIGLVADLENFNVFRIHGFYTQTMLGKEDAGKFILDGVKLLRLAHLIASGVSEGESKGRI